MNAAAPSLPETIVKTVGNSETGWSRRVVSLGLGQEHQVLPGFITRWLRAEFH